MTSLKFYFNSVCENSAVKTSRSDYLLYLSLRKLRYSRFCGINIVNQDSFLRFSYGI